MLMGRIKGFLGYSIPGRLCISNANDSSYKVQRPSCEAREALLSVLSPLNEKLYQLLEINPGPHMEQKPFPMFHAKAAKVEIENSQYQIA